MQRLPLYLILGALTILALTTCEQAKLSPQDYTAKSLIQIVAPGDPATSMVDQKTLVKEVDLMLSPDNLQAVIKSLKLDAAWGARFKPTHEPLTPEETMRHLHEILIVEAKKDTDMISITAHSDIAQEAADIANAVVDQYQPRRQPPPPPAPTGDTSALRSRINAQEEVVEAKQEVVTELRRDFNLPGQKNSIPDPPPWRDAERDLDRQQAVLNGLTDRLHELTTLVQPPPMTSVRVLYRASASN